MKISYDIDGTFAKYPETFLKMKEMLKASGHEVGILTGRMMKDCLNVVEKLEDWDFIITDEENYTVDGKFKLTMEEHAKLWKARMIKEHNITIHYDDCGEWILEGLVDLNFNATVVKIV